MHRGRRAPPSDFSFYIPRNPNDRSVYFVALSLILVEFIVHLTVTIPRLCDGSSYCWLVRLIIWFSLLFNVLTNMHMFCKTDTTTAGLLLPVTLKTGWRYCSHCEANSPPRSVHCAQCNRCVLRHNHHCMFTGCCVGYKNARYFIVLLFYLCLSSVYFLTTSLPYTLHLAGSELQSPSEGRPGEASAVSLYVKVALTLILPVFSFVFGYVSFSTAVQCAVTTINVLCVLISAFMCLFQLVLTARNQTVHEWAIGNNQYSVGIRDNLIQIFGNRWRVAPFCALVRSQLPLDGTDFPTSRDAARRRRKQN